MIRDVSPKTKIKWISAMSPVPKYDKETMTNCRRENHSELHTTKSSHDHAKTIHAVASEIFQSVMTEKPAGLRNIKLATNDILTFGRSKAPKPAIIAHPLRMMLKQKSIKEWTTTGVDALKKLN